MSIIRESIKQESNIESGKSLLDALKKNKTLSLVEFKNILEIAHYLLQSGINEPDKYNLALSIICHTSEYLPDDNFIKQLLFDCISSSRVFLYNEMLSNKYADYLDSIDISLFNNFSEAFYTLDTNTVLTREQKHLFETFQKKKRIIVSAPTSFGKSRIIQEIITHNTYHNIAIILPSIALLNETYIKFKENEHLKDYKLINSINRIISGTKNIFILTPEKMDLLLDQNPGLTIDFFVMDEIYKIQDDEDRKKIFTHCLYRLSKQKADFYLIGPYFKHFSKAFLEKTRATFIQYSGEVVQKDTFDLSKIKSKETYTINGKEFKKLKDKDKNLLNIVSALNEQTLVYIGRKDSVETRSKKIAAIRSKEVQSDLADYLKENIAAEWSLVKCLSRGIGFHHSAVPKYIQSEIVDAFNNGSIDVIVCTSTLTEGVNTSAKNVVIFDNFKGEVELTGFDVKNIKGRAGRFYIHFLGNVYCLEKLNSEADKENIEFSYFDNNNLEAEEVIQVDKKELVEQNLQLRNNIEDDLKRNQIPFELVLSNKFIPLQKQLSLIEELRNNKAILDDTYFNGPFPEKDQLDSILTYCHEFLFNDSDKKNRTFDIGALLKQTKYYVYLSPTIKQIIQNQRGAKIDTKVRSAFSFITHFFEFALPKYLTAFENIFNFVYKEQHPHKNGISLKYLITRFEFGFVDNHQIALKEAGLPNDIIQKIESKFKDCESLDEIRTKYRLKPFLIKSLNAFEKKIFDKYI